MDSASKNKKVKNLPSTSKELDQNEVFLLQAYEEYHNETKEWQYLEKNAAKKKQCSSQNERKTCPFSAHIPLLIRECTRMIPFRDPTTNYINFHPFNMPETIIKKINLIGITLTVQKNTNNWIIQIYDGTESIDVIYPTRDYERNIAFEEKTCLIREHSQNKNTDKPQAKDRRIFQTGIYVSIYGYLILSSHDIGGVEDNNFWKTGSLPTVLFRAYNVKRISEKEYNKMLSKWLSGPVKERYSCD